MSQNRQRKKLSSSHWESCTSAPGSNQKSQNTRDQLRVKLTIWSPGHFCESTVTKKLGENRRRQLEFSLRECSTSSLTNIPNIHRGRYLATWTWLRTAFQAESLTFRSPVDPLKVPLFSSPWAENLTSEQFFAETVEELGRLNWYFRNYFLGLICFYKYWSGQWDRTMGLPLCTQLWYLLHLGPSSPIPQRWKDF